MYFHQMYLYAAKLLPNNNGLAEELVSDCFIKLWKNRKNIQITHSVKHYLFTMLRNSVIDNIRKKKLITEPLSENLQAPSNEKFFDDQKQYAILYLALKKLPEQCRRILEMAAFDSLSYQEIADKLHISTNTVKTQISRAYKSLKVILHVKSMNNPAPFEIKRNNK